MTNMNETKSMLSAGFSFITKLLRKVQSSADWAVCSFGCFVVRVVLKKMSREISIGREHLPAIAPPATLHVCVFENNQQRANIPRDWQTLRGSQDGGSLNDDGTDLERIHHTCEKMSLQTCMITTIKLSTFLYAAKMWGYFPLAWTDAFGLR